MGFTLIELLVVISIIALLISILLPTLKSARDRARQLQCANQQRQILVGYRLYAQDHGYYPQTNEPTNANNGGWWKTVLYEGDYLATAIKVDTGGISCPSNDLPHGAGGVRRDGYSASRAFNPAPNMWGVVGNGQPTSLKVDADTSPSTFMAVGESGYNHGSPNQWVKSDFIPLVWPNSTYYDWSQLYGPHGADGSDGDMRTGVINGAFLDGHVLSMSHTRGDPYAKEFARWINRYKEWDGNN